ncbi:MAG: hypothetical protein ABEK17_03290, partial [Candidatus Aenigmatarchaeota archaeon]
MSPDKLNRRDFLKVAGGTLFGLLLNNTMANPPSMKENIIIHPSENYNKGEDVEGDQLEIELVTFPQYGHVDRHDDLVKEFTKYWNEEFEEIPGYEKLNPNIPKA